MSVWLKKKSLEYKGSEANRRAVTAARRQAIWSDAVKSGLGEQQKAGTQIEKKEE